MDSDRDRPDQGERLARLALYLGLNCNSSAFHRVMRHVGSADAAFGQDLRVMGVNLTPLLTGGLFEDACGRLEYAESHGLDIVIWGDDHYPVRLDEIADPPPVLWVKGRLEPTDQFSVALVGSREASSNGLSLSRRLAREGALKGLTIVSGLAKGVDAQAHRGALEAGGRTLAVLGCGLDWVYPKENARLYEEIAAQGALISEYTPETRPLPINFPRRNRIIAGLSLAVVVTEARERSGALITARLALEMNREVMALPGPVGLDSAKGANKLIKSGAALVESMDEVLAEIKPRLLEGLRAANRPEIIFPELPAETEAKPEPAPVPKDRQPPKLKPVASAPSPPLPPEPEPDTPEGKVTAALRRSPQDTDSLVRTTGIGAAEMAGLLLTLELTGRIVRLTSGQFELQ